MIFRIHPSSGVPIYLQIVAQVKQAVAAGMLRKGDALPSVRTLAGELRVTPNTVVRAYSELERASIVKARPGGGTYIEMQPQGLLRDEKLRRLRPLADQLAVESRQLGVNGEAVHQLVEESLKQLEKQP